MATLTTSYQKIADKYIGEVSGSGVSAKSLYLRIYARYSTQDITNNKSTVYYKSTLYVSGSGTYFFTGNTTTKSLSGTGATTQSGSANGDYYLGETKLNEISGTVSHSADGTATVSSSASWSSTPWGVSGSVSASATLPTIPRATTPTLSATTATMGNSITITMNPASSSFKHKLRYRWLSTTTDRTAGLSIGAEFTKQGNTTATFTIPTALADEIPNSNSGKGTIYCYTYNSSGTHIGTKTVSFTANVPSYTPTISSIALAGNNLLSSAYVQGKSTVTVTTTASSSYGASITSYSATVDGKSYTGQKFTTSALTSGSKSAAVTVTDSRGKTASLTSSAITVYAYANPSITEFTLVRNSTTPTTVVATVKGSISAINNKNAKTVKVTLNGVTNTITSSSYTISGTTTFTNVSTDSSFTGVATLTDSYTSASKTVVLPTVAVTMDFHSSGKGVAFGKVAESEGVLDVAWKIKNDSVMTLLGGIGKAIPSSANLNTLDYIVPGNYVCSLNTTAQTLVNSPTSFAFKMTVYNCLSDSADVQTADNIYLVREIVNFDGNMWVQYVRKEKNWFYSSWKTVVDSGNFATYFNSNFASNFSSSFASSFSSSLASTVKDYVVETGTSGIWTYRKWNSGIAECWGIYTMASSCTLAWGSLYYSNKTCPRINYPFTFTSRPQETVSLRLDSYSGWIYADSEGKGMNTTTQTAVYGFLRPATMGETTIRYEFTVIGKWK